MNKPVINSSETHGETTKVAALSDSDLVQLAQNETAVAVTESAEEVVVNVPASGQEIVIEVEPGQTLRLNFDPDAALAELKDGDLYLTFENDGVLIFKGFADASTGAQPVELVYPDGTIVPGQVIVAQLGEAGEATVLAAGPGATSGGISEYESDPGSTIDVLGPLGVLDPTALLFGVEFQEEFVPLGEPEGELIAGFEGGFEDAEPNSNIGDLTDVFSRIDPGFVPQDGAVLIELTISNFPPGVQVFLGGTNPENEVPVINGSVTVGTDDLDQIYFLLPDNHDDTDFVLDLEAVILNPTTGQTSVITGTLLVTVDAVADVPIVDASDVVGVEDAVDIPLPISTQVIDPDGSEVIQQVIVFAGLPDGTSFNMGSFNSATGELTLSGDDAAAAANGALTMTLPEDWSGDISAQVFVTVFDNPTDGELTLDNNTATGSDSFQITIRPTGDVEITANDVVDRETDADLTVGLDINPVVTDNDGSESLTSVVIEFDSLDGVVGFNMGTLVGNVLTIQGGDLANIGNLQVTFEKDWSGVLTGTATAETNEGGVASDAFSVTINVEGDVRLEPFSEGEFVANPDITVTETDAVLQVNLNFYNTLDLFISDFNGTGTEVLEEVRLVLSGDAIVGTLETGDFVYDGSASVVYNASNGELSITGTDAEIQEAFYTLKVNLPEDWSGALTVDVYAASNESPSIDAVIGGATQEDDQHEQFTVTVNPEGDVQVSASDINSTETDAALVLQLGAALTIGEDDNDASEVITEVRIVFAGGVPAGTTFSLGSYDVGTSTLTLTGADLATFLGDHSTLSMTLPKDWAGSIDVTVGAQSNESQDLDDLTAFGGAQADVDDTQVATLTIDVDVEGDVDILPLNNVNTTETDSTLQVSLGATLGGNVTVTDTNGQVAETLTEVRLVFGQDIGTVITGWSWSGGASISFDSGENSLAITGTDAEIQQALSSLSVFVDADWAGTISVDVYAQSTESPDIDDVMVSTPDEDDQHESFDIIVDVEGDVQVTAQNIDTEEVAGVLTIDLATGFDLSITDTNGASPEEFLEARIVLSGDADLLSGVETGDFTTASGATLSYSFNAGTGEGTLTITGTSAEIDDTFTDLSLDLDPTWSGTLNGALYAASDESLTIDEVITAINGGETDPEGEDDQAEFFTITVEGPPVGGDEIDLLVDEEALDTVGAIGSNPPNPAEEDSDDLEFTAGGDDLTTFAFVDVAGLITDTDGDGNQDLWWDLDDSQTIIGYSDAGLTQAVVRLELSASTITAGNLGTAAVTAILLDNILHPVSLTAENELDLGSVTVKASEADGDFATGTVNVAVKDDVPTLGTIPDTALIVWDDASAPAVETFPFTPGADVGSLQIVGYTDLDGFNEVLSPDGQTLIYERGDGTDVFQLVLDDSGEYTFSVLADPTISFAGLNFEAVVAGGPQETFIVPSDDSTHVQFDGTIFGVDVENNTDLLNPNSNGFGVGDGNINEGDGFIAYFLEDDLTTPRLVDGLKFEIDPTGKVNQIDISWEIFDELGASIASGTESVFPGLNNIDVVFSSTDPGPGFVWIPVPEDFATLELQFDYPKDSDSARVQNFSIVQADIIDDIDLAFDVKAVDDDADVTQTETFTIGIDGDNDGDAEGTNSGIGKVFQSIEGIDTYVGTSGTDTFIYQEVADIDGDGDGTVDWADVLSGVGAGDVLDVSALLAEIGGSAAADVVDLGGGNFQLQVSDDTGANFQTIATITSSLTEAQLDAALVIV